MTKLQETRTQLREALEIYKLLGSDCAAWEGLSKAQRAALADIKQLCKVYVFHVEQEAKDR
jgi:hypothetical protein